MTINCERLPELRSFHMEPTTEACINCIHFQQHYLKNGIPVYSGVCCYPRLKNRKVFDVCGNFQNISTEST